MGRVILEYGIYYYKGLDGLMDIYIYDCNMKEIDRWRRYYLTFMNGGINNVRYHLALLLVCR